MAPENGHDDGEGNRNTVFIDTSLETHLVTIISDSDSVSDLKRKIVLEHRQCFPATGDIKIHCLKVKRRGNYYHLADSMLVKSAFGDTKKNWFLSVDASPLDQCEGIQHNKPGDQHQHQLALPWVNDSLSIDKHDNHVEDRPSKQLSLIHGSSSKHHPPKIVPFVNQKAPSLDLDQLTSDDSCKKVSKNVEEDRSSNLEPDLEQQQQLDSKVEDKLCSVVNEEMISKKRTSDVHNEEDTCVKKRRKTQRTQGDVKGSEQVRGVLTDDIDMVKDMGTSMNDENSIEDKSKTKNTALDGVVTTKALNDEHTGTMLVSQKKPRRSKKVKKSASAHDQVATVVVPSSVQVVGDETRSQTNTKASENMAADVAVVLEKNNIQQEAPFQSSQKEEIGNELVEEAGIENEIPSSSMKGDEMLVKHADDVVVDKSSTVCEEKVTDEQKNDKTGDEKSEGLEKTLIHDSLVSDNKGDDDLIVKEVKVAEPTESHRSRVHKEKSRKEIKGNRIKKKDVGKSSKEDEIMKHSNDGATGTNEEDNILPPPSERKVSLETTYVGALHVDKDVDFSKTEMKPCQQQNAEIPEEKQNENMNDTKKKRKKRKTKKSAAGNEGEEPLTKHEKIADVGTTDSGKNISKDAQKISDEGLVEKQPKKNSMKSLTCKLELESSVKSNKTPVAVSQVPKGNDVISNEIDFMEYFSPTQQPPNKTAAAVDNVENGKDTKLSVVREKKPRKKSKEQQDDKAIQSLPRNENNKELLVSKKVPEAASTGSRVGVKDQNINEIKTPSKTTKQIDAKPAQVNKPQPQPQPSPESGSSSESVGRSFKSQKITKQQPTVGQNNNHVKNMKKSAPVKSLLNTPGTIFGNDSDDDSSANDNGTIDSDSSTRTPSRKSSSSSGESDSSIDSRRYAVKRKEGAGKNNINSQSRLKNISMADLLRSSSRFKKARVTASQQVNDTESQPVDFVPESEPLA